MYKKHSNPDNIQKTLKTQNSFRKHSNLIKAFKNIQTQKAFKHIKSEPLTRKKNIIQTNLKQQYNNDIIRS